MGSKAAVVVVAVAGPDVVSGWVLCFWSGIDWAEDMF